MDTYNRCFSILQQVIGFVLLIIVGSPVTGFSQISPFTPGNSKTEIDNLILTKRNAQGLEKIQEGSQQWMLKEVDETGYMLEVQIDFEEAISHKILTEWTATTVDYRVVLRKWFDQEIEDRNLLDSFERDPRMEELLVNSYKEGLAKAAVYVSVDKSQRIILIFYSTQQGAFLSHMHQVYFWPEG